MQKWFKRSVLTFLLATFTLTPVMVTFNSCEDTSILEMIFDENTVNLLASWLAEDEKLDSIPQDLDVNDNTTGIPTAVDLTAKFPPIGNQGQYGTCVAWAAGYNLKTALNGIDKGLSAAQLAQAQNQTSPKDLFWAIPSGQKGDNCNGTQFEAAMDLMISRGAASLAIAPYSSLDGCNNSPDASWTTDAANNKLDNYRKIADNSDASSMKVDNFKAYLAEGRPIVIGAKLGDRFMQWNNEQTISSDTYLNPGMQHAYHAMVLAGYDDNRSAFRVINSWGPEWGDRGYIWVDYDFFVNEFCFAAFVAKNKSNISTGNGSVDNVVNGTDLLAWNLTDGDNSESTDPLDREITYNVYNSGTNAISGSQDWSILYVLYDAFDANNYQILLHDYYTNDFSTTNGDNDYLSPEEGGVGTQGSWWNYISNIPSGRSVAAALYNTDDADFSFTYSMDASITGEYYLVLIADGFNDIAEQNEDNNYYFFSRSDGKPFKFENGIITNPEAGKKSRLTSKQPARFANTETQTLVKGNNLNTYSPKEIMSLLDARRQSGDLQRKVAQYHLKKTNQAPTLKRKARM